MRYEYCSDTMSSNYGSTGERIADRANGRAIAGWRLIVAAPKHEFWELLFERPVAEPESLSPEQRAALNHDRSGFIASASPPEVPSHLGEHWPERSRPDSDWEELREVLRQQTGRLAQLEQIIRRRDEVIGLVRGMTKNWTPASKNYIDDDVDTILAALARLDEEERPRDPG